MNPLRRLKRFLASKKTVVLMYHRIANPEADPWQLAVSPENFEAQLRYLKKKFRLVTPQQVAKGLGRKFYLRHRVCITFDDGYLDNFTHAKPLLEKHRCPAAFFITTSALLKGRPYWWDELQDILFSSPALPSPFSFFIGGEGFHAVLENKGHLTPEQQEKHRTWVWSAEPPTERCRLYFAIWKTLRPLPQEEIDAWLLLLKRYTAWQESASETRPMSAENLRELSRSPFVQIGLHTHTHPYLPAQTKHKQRYELEENKKWLEEICERVVPVLTYPHGGFNADTLALAKNLKIESAFTTSGEVPDDSTPLHQIGRYQVLNHGAVCFKRQMKKIISW